MLTAAAIMAVVTFGHPQLLRHGLRLEYATLGWNVLGVVVLAISPNPALAGFGLDSLIEIGASVVVVWELTGVPAAREERAMRLIGAGFAALVLYLIAQISYTFATSGRPTGSPLGIAWTAMTLIVMLVLATGKLRTSRALDNPVLRTEARVTLIDAYLAAAVLLGLVLNDALGWWWADPAAALVMVYYAAREAHHALTHRQKSAVA